MAQGRSTKIISMIEQIRTSRLSIKNSLSSGFRLQSHRLRVPEHVPVPNPPPCQKIVVPEIEVSSFWKLPTTRSASQIFYLLSRDVYQHRWVQRHINARHFDQISGRNPLRSQMCGSSRYPSFVCEARFLETPRDWRIEARVKHNLVAGQ